MTTSSATVAPGSTNGCGMNVGHADGSAVHDHGGVSRFGNDGAVDPCFGIELPDRATPLLLSDMHHHDVAGGHGLAKARLVDAHEVDQLALKLLAQGLDDENSRRLRHGLDDQHARHDRVARKVPLELRLVDGDVLDSDGTFTRDNVQPPGRSSARDSGAESIP